MFPDTTESFPIYETKEKGRVEKTSFLMNKADINYRYPNESNLKSYYKEGRNVECLMYVEAC